jgi:hypothetical protein
VDPSIAPTETLPNYVVPTYEGWLWTIGGPLLLVVQLACLVHVLKTGRPYWWLWIIFGFPLVGLAAYVFLEVRPSVGRLNVQALLWKLKGSNERIRILREQLEDSSTVKNRLALAAVLHEASRFDEECEVLAEGLRGAFKDDATLLLKLAEAHLEAGRAAEAEAILSKTPVEGSSDVRFQMALLNARVAGALGRTAEAETTLQELVSRRRSEAPRFYLAQLQLANGQFREGQEILRDVVRQYRRGTLVWRFQERRWFYAARRLLRIGARGQESGARTSH